MPGEPSVTSGTAEWHSSAGPEKSNGVMCRTGQKARPLRKVRGQAMRVNSRDGCAKNRRWPDRTSGACGVGSFRKHCHPLNKGGWEKARVQSR